MQVEVEKSRHSRPANNGLMAAGCWRQGNRRQPSIRLAPQAIEPSEPDTVCGVPAPRAIVLYASQKVSIAQVENVPISPAATAQGFRPVGNEPDTPLHC